MIREIRTVLVRDLRAIRDGLNAYASEASIWAVPPGITNSAGTLALHVTGNLRYYIGAQLGGSGYVRDRDAEFADRDLPLEEIERRIDAAITSVTDTLERLDEHVLDRDYPIAFGDITLITRVFLTHLVSHTAYHLGQIDYHRRLITGVNHPAGPSLAGLTEAT